MKSSTPPRIFPSAQRVLALRRDVREQKIAQEAIDRADAHYGVSMC
jgi:hypothetical protein